MVLCVETVDPAWVTVQTESLYTTSYRLRAISTSPSRRPSTRDAPKVRERDGERSVPAAHWGYLPGWAKDFKRQRPQPISVSVETVSTSPMFRKSNATARASIPAASC
ncbi:SOS response-associated peptidase [Clavibacter michiganensis subsp. michiganensis]|nr:SOS response-associated peptidase [Clavibacter michiganensis subsp. michiganensis]